MDGSRRLPKDLSHTLVADDRPLQTLSRALESRAVFIAALAPAGEAGGKATRALGRSRGKEGEEGGRVEGSVRRAVGEMPRRNRVLLVEREGLEAGRKSLGRKTSGRA